MIEKKRNIIIRYLKSLLETHEHAKSQHSLNEEDLADLITDESIRSLGRSELRQKMHAIHNDMIAREKRRDRLKWILLLVAVFIGVGGFLLIKSIGSKTDAPANIYAAYFEPYPSLFEQKNGNEAPVDSSILSQAMKAYANGQYKLANEAFQIAENQGIDFNQPQRFYRAMSLMSINQTEKAIEILLSLKNEGGGPFEEQVVWFLSLAYLKTNQVDKAKQMLRATVDSTVSHFNRKEMVEVLERLSLN